MLIDITETPEITENAGIFLYKKKIILVQTLDEMFMDSGHNDLFSD